MRVISSCAVVLLTLVSCADDASPTDDAGGGGSPEEVATFIDTVCSLYEPCCATAESSKDRCIANLQQISANLKLDTLRATTCLDALREESSKSTFCVQAPASIACSAVFKHRQPLPQGASCERSSDCANGPAPHGDTSCANGKCRAVTHGKEGDACIGTRVAGDTDTLVKVPEEGPVAVCDASEGLYCAESTAKCTKRGDIGGPCEGSDISCVDAAYCPTTSSRCTNRTGGGERCVDQYECAAGHQCTNDDEGGGACIAFVAEGGDCARGDECDVHLVCDSSSKCVKDADLYASACTGKLIFAEQL